MSLKQGITKTDNTLPVEEMCYMIFSLYAKS